MGLYVLKATGIAETMADILETRYFVLSHITETWLKNKKITWCHLLKTQALF